MALSLRAFLRQDVVEVRLGAFKAALASTAKSLRRTAIGFHLRHYLLHL